MWNYVKLKPITFAVAIKSLSYNYDSVYFSATFYNSIFSYYCISNELTVIPMCKPFVFMS